MNEKSVSPRVVLRIPGDWSQPQELLERLPEGVRLDAETLTLPDGTELEFSPLAPDDQFAEVFRSACRRPPSDDELAVLDRYRVNAVLSGPGGSLKAAFALMQGGAALVKAGAAGVFIDNSALAYGGNDWLEMADDGSPDAISFAFVSIIRGRQETYTMGMQVLGFHDLLFNTDEVNCEESAVIDTIRYVAAGNKRIDVGHVLADLNGPRFHVVARVDDEFDSKSVMHNPYGRLKIVSVKDIEERN